MEIPATTLLTGLVPFSLTYLRLCAPWGEKLVSPATGIMYFHLHELAGRSLMKKLRAPFRWALARNVGRPAWRILDRVLDRWAGRTVNCRTLIRRSGFLTEGGAS